MKREHDETYENYVARRKMLNKVCKQYLKGAIVWFSRIQGTYTNPARAERKRLREQFK